MRRVIINLDPMEKDAVAALQRTVSCIQRYNRELKRDGERITATWDSGQSIYVYHDKQKEPCIYSPHIKEQDNGKKDWYKG